MKDLFEQRNMTQTNNNSSAETVESSVTNGRSNNPRLEQHREYVEDSPGDFVARHEISSWGYDRDLASAHHRTTSIHRNIDRRQNTTPRTVPRNLEERRKWVTQAGKL